MTVLQRMQSPTPGFFKKVRTIGLVLAAISATILAAPIALPTIVITVATYVGVAGAVATAVSQTAVEEEPHPAVYGY
jgi:hypothetical protein